MLSNDLVVPESISPAVFGASRFHVAVNMHRHIGFFARVYRKKRFWSRPVNYYSNSTAVFQLENTLLVCGDIRPNAGYQAKADNSDSSAKSGSNSKSKFKFPFKVCDKPVKSNQKGILCEECCCWHHIKCVGMNHNIYSSLASSDVPWFCCDCGLPNFSDSFFDESRSSESTEGITEVMDSIFLVHWKDKISILNAYFSMLGVYETRFLTFKSCCYLIHLTLLLLRKFSAR